MPSHRYISPEGVVGCEVDGERVELPVFPGIFKHPTVQQLREILVDPVAARKYTRLALRKAPWSALRLFPRRWLLACLDTADLPTPRRRALELMLDVPPLEPPDERGQK